VKPFTSENQQLLLRLAKRRCEGRGRAELRDASKSREIEEENEL